MSYNGLRGKKHFNLTLKVTLKIYLFIGDH